MNKLSLILIFFYGCLDIPEKQLFNPIEIPVINELSATVLDAFQVELSWELDSTLFNDYFSEQQNQMIEISNFIIYVSLEESNNYSPLDTINIDNLFFDLNSFRFIDTLLFVDDYYYDKQLKFYIDVIGVNNFVSISSDTTITKLIYPIPLISTENSNDNKLIIEIEDPLCSANFIIIEKIMDSDSLYSQRDTLELFNCDIEIFYDSLSLDLENSIEIKPNIFLPKYKTIPPEEPINYIIKFLQNSNYENNKYRLSPEYSIEKLYASNEFDYSIRAKTDNSLRVYLSSDWNEIYDTTLIYIKNNNQWSLHDKFYFNMNNTNLYTGTYHLDIENISSGDSLFIIQKGQNAYIYDINTVKVVDLLSIPGFTLVDDGVMVVGCVMNCFGLEVEAVDHFYMSINEVNNSSALDYINKYMNSGLPIEFNYNQAEAFIEELNDNDIYNYNFTIPTSIEWEYASKMSYNSNSMYEYRKYPWGNTINYYNANYINSTNSIGLKDIGLYTDYSSVFGLNDLAGNILEWTFRDSSGIDSAHFARGGGYWHGPEDVTTLSEYLVSDSNTAGMGLRVVMRREINND